jgi:hypothetical protein
MERSINFGEQVMNMVDIGEVDRPTNRTATFTFCSRTREVANWRWLYANDR